LLFEGKFRFVFFSHRGGTAFGNRAVLLVMAATVVGEIAGVAAVRSGARAK